MHKNQYNIDTQQTSDHPHKGLPPPNHSIRWVKSRKRAILEAIANKMITPEELHRFYGISEQELVLWQAQYRNEGENGLSSSALIRNHIHNIKKLHSDKSPLSHDRKRRPQDYDQIS